MHPIGIPQPYVAPPVNDYLQFNLLAIMRTASNKMVEVLEPVTDSPARYLDTDSGPVQS